MKSRHIGFILTRLAGTDGVSLETKKWVQILKEQGHDCAFIGGELDTPRDRSSEVEEFHFKHPEVRSIHRKSFRNDFNRPRSLTNRIHRMKAELKDELYEFCERFNIDLLIPENVLSIPLHLPLGLAVTELIAETGLPTIAHHHDFYWERDRFSNNNVGDLLSAAFPPTFGHLEHVVINSTAAQQLAHRKGESSRLVPNVLEFEEPPSEPGEYASDLRSSFGIEQDELFVLQPTRIVPRKRIEEAIELVSYLDRPSTIVISHASGDEGHEYENYLRRYAEHMGVNMLLVAERIGPDRGRTEDGRKIYSLEDVYSHADVVTYPSEYEGFGNAFIETIYHKKPVVVNNYSVFERDIKPKGFEVIDYDGYITSKTVNDLREVLEDGKKRQSMVEKNYQLGKKHYSFRTLREQLRMVLHQLF